MDQLITEAPRLLLPSIGEAAAMLVIPGALIAGVVAVIVVFARSSRRAKPTTTPGESPETHTASAPPR